MTATITIGTWIIPTVLTIIAFLTAYLNREPSTGGGMYFDFSGLADMFFYGLATIFSLIVWLIWSLLT